MSKQRVTMFLGAGASVAFLKPDKNGNPLTTPSLTDLLMPNRAEEFFKKTDYALSKLNANRALSRNKDAYEIYKKVYLKCVEHSMHHGFNFQETIHLIDSVVDVLGDHNSRYKVAQSWGNESSSFHLVEFFKGRLEEKHNAAIEKLPFDVRHYLLQHIAEHHAPCEEAHKTWCDFFVRMKKKGYAISVFNLNYDRLMMEVAEKLSQNGIFLYTGFDLSAENSEFNTSEFYKAENILAQLHGSIHFVPFGESSVTTGVRYYQNLKEASLERLRYATAENTQAKSRDYNWAIVTGLSKFEYIAKELYATYYRRLIRDLDESEVVVIIGYGGGDRHMNMLLKSSLTKGKKLFVVDYAEDDGVDKRVVDCFGQKLSEFLHDDFFNSDAIIKKGVAVVLSNKEKCELFTCGTKSFLKEKSV